LLDRLSNDHPGDDRLGDDGPEGCAEHNAEEEKEDGQQIGWVDEDLGFEDREVPDEDEPLYNPAKRAFDFPVQHCVDFGRVNLKKKIR